MNKTGYFYRVVIIFILFLILTIIFTFPLFFKMHSFIAGFESTDEVYGTIWHFWWLKYSWLKNIKFLPFSFIAVPFSDMKYTIATSYPLWNFFGKWLTVLTNKIFTYNLIIISGFLLSGIFMFSLVYYCCKNIMASILSGIIYAFCPYHFARAWQHMALGQIQWFPLYFLGLLRLQQKINYKNIFFCSMIFSIIILTEYYYAYFTFLITLLFLISIFFYNWKEKFRLRKFNSDIKIFKCILLIMLIAFLLTLPATFQIIKTILSAPKTELVAKLGYKRSFSDLFEQSAKPLSYLLPAIVHPLLGKFTEKFIGSQAYGISLTEHTLYLGWTPLILALVVFRRWRKRYLQPMTRNEDLYIGFFVFLAIAAWLFSQSPWWKFGALKIYTPSFFMYKFFPMFRAYCRFGVIVMLAIAVLAGFELAFILGKFKSKNTKFTIAVLCCGLVMFEFWNYPPFKVIDVSEVPAVYYWLKTQPDDFVIAEYPLDIEGPNEMYKFYQTTHEKKIINGTFPGTYANKVLQTITKLSDLSTAEILKWMGVKYALVHREDYLKTELIEDREELDRIPYNSGLKFIRSFIPQECPRKDIICIRRVGPIDIYEVITLPVKPEVKE